MSTLSKSEFGNNQTLVQYYLNNGCADIDAAFAAYLNPPVH